MVVRFNVIHLLAEAIQGTWRVRNKWLRSLPMPLLASMIILFLVLNLRVLHPTLSQACNSAVGVIPISLFAVACHRAILYGHYPKLTPTRSHRASIRFVAVCVLVSLVSFATAQAFAVLDAAARDESITTPVFAAFWLATAYVVARFTLILPMLAVDAGRNLWVSWDLTAGNGWRILFATTLPWVAAIPIWVAAMALVSQFASSDRDAILPLFVPGSVVLVGYYLVTAFEAGILSFLFLTLRRENLRGAA